MSSVKQQEFIQHLIDKGDRAFANTSFQEYLLTKTYVRSNGRIHPYSFEGHAYLAEIASLLPTAQSAKFLKAVQVGISTLLNGETIWRAEMTPLKLKWYFPTADTMKIYVQDRFFDMIDISPHLKKIADQTNSIRNVHLLKYLQSTIAFGATETMKGVKTFDSDGNYLDEFDEHNQEHAESANDRTDHSKLALRRVCSQASVEEFGIHAEWLDSNQMMFLIKCVACNAWNNLVERFVEEPGSIFGVKTGKVAKVVYACKCGATLNPQKGTYVAARKNHPELGFQISQFFNTIKTPEQHYERWKKAELSSIKKANYIRSVVGWPNSTSAEKPVTQSLIESVRGDHCLRDECGSFTFMGADQGDIIHMVFGEETSDCRIRIIGLAKTSVLDVTSHVRMIKNFQVYSGILDALPNKSWSVKLAELFPDQLRVQYFKTNFRIVDEKLVSPDSDDHIEAMQINRNESLEETIEMIKKGLFIFPDKSRHTGYALELLEEFETHLKMLIRERGEDENGKPTYSFKKRVPNHFGMALNSLRLAYDLGAP
ncbi:phage terminase large subunit family protein [Leptospira interrogans]|uniref:phage terminase large subunit family protein n=1 Tax=Leptospira interrogans TaxID=173 RepID=UPI000773A819|nr:phage terminase large subunit family protein [Leptospira interrogans]